MCRFIEGMAIRGRAHTSGGRLPLDLLLTKKKRGSIQFANHALSYSRSERDIEFTIWKVQPVAFPLEVANPRCWIIIVPGYRMRVANVTVRMHLFRRHLVEVAEDTTPEIGIAEAVLLCGAKEESAVPAEEKVQGVLSECCLLDENVYAICSSFFASPLIMLKLSPVTCREYLPVLLGLEGGDMHDLKIVVVVVPVVFSIREEPGH